MDVVRIWWEVAWYSPGMMVGSAKGDADKKVRKSIVEYLSTRYLADADMVQ
jgi:hypothetical protein